MTSEQLNSIIRTVLTLIGAFLTGGGVNYLFGTVIDTAYWQEISGIVLAIVSVVWSIVSKTVDIEKLEGTIRQIVTFICGILVARGLLNAQTGMAVIAFIGAIIPLIQSYLGKKKSDQLAVGIIQPAQLRKSA